MFFCEKCSIHITLSAFFIHDVIMVCVYKKGHKDFPSFKHNAILN